MSPAGPQDEREREPEQQGGRRPGRWDGRQEEQRAAGQRGDRTPGPLVREYRPPYERQSGQVVAVLLYENGGHSVVWPEAREDHNKPWFRGAYTVFEVLLGRNVSTFDLALPAAGDAEFFDATAKVHWEVEDPLLVVRQRVWDVRELMHDDLLDGLRNVSRRFRLTESQRADEAVRAELGAGRISLGQDLGLRTRIHVFVDLSERVKKRVQDLDAIGVEMDADALKAEAARRKEALERDLVRARARELETVLGRGDEAEIIHFMAQNPDKAWDIRRAIQQEKREGQADLLGLLGRLMDGGHLERHDISEHMREAIRYLRESSSGVLGGATERVLAGRQPQRPALEERQERQEPPEPVLPSWEDGDERQRHVYEPTQVESGADRDRDRDWDHDRDRRDGHGGAPRRPSRPSAGFDDWGDD